MIDSVSSISCKLSLLCRSQKIAVATGFLWKHERKTYLISNWHVFSGRNTYTGQPIHSQHAIPDQIQFELLMKTFLGDEWMPFDLALCNVDNEAVWLQHPALGQQIDVAALEIPKEFLSYGYSYLDAESDRNQMFRHVGADVFIVGFPLGIQRQLKLPIWKRGSIASEVDLPVDDLPLILIDSATRDGMSGSPVYLRSTGTAHNTQQGLIMTDGPINEFLGVYSGRFGGEDEFSAQIGRVWKSSTISEVVTGDSKGSYELRNE